MPEVASVHEDVRWLLPQTHERIDTRDFHLAAIVATHARRGTAMQAGRILVDGVPLTDLNLRNLHRKTAIVAQDTQLFATRYLSTSGRVFAFARQGGASFSYHGETGMDYLSPHRARAPCTRGTFPSFALQQFTAVPVLSLGTRLFSHDASCRLVLIFLYNRETTAAGLALFKFIGAT